MTKRDDMTSSDLAAGGALPPTVGVPPPRPGRKRPRASAVAMAPARREGRGLELRAGSSVMVAVFLPSYVAAEVALDGGERAEDLHVTLALLGKPDALDATVLARVCEACAAIAATHSAVVGRLSGTGLFQGGSPDAPDVLHATVDAPGLDELRVDLVRALEGAGVPPRREHGFDPHVTLVYQKSGDAVPSVRVDTTPFVFGALTLAVAGKREVFQLLRMPLIEQLAAGRLRRLPRRRVARG
jgi:2'-5' RNA ligase